MIVKIVETGAVVDLGDSYAARLVEQGEAVPHREAPKPAPVNPPKPAPVNSPKSAPAQQKQKGGKSRKGD